MLVSLQAKDFRNFESLDLEPSPQFNIIYGANGSGKTSILEMIHFLGLGKSFRSHLVGHVIRNSIDSFLVFGEVLHDQVGNKIPLGVEKSRDGTSRMKINGENIKSAADLAKILPIQVLNQEGYALLEDGPKYRRNFLDWGVFHVEHSFLALWRQFQKILLQRNAELRNGATRAQLKGWDMEFVRIALALEALRRRYVEQLIPRCLEILNSLLKNKEIIFFYYRGWKDNLDLFQILTEVYSRDQILGYTQFGPHRADLRMCVGKIPVQDVLSRGEQKLLVYALRLAQGILLRELMGKPCVYLVDELPAELDPHYQEKIAEYLVQLRAQVFVTGACLNNLSTFREFQVERLFHVEHGRVNLV